MIYGTLLVIHVAGGAVALLGACGAIGARSLGLPQRWHSRPGHLFVQGMALAVLTAIPMSLVRFDPFLFLISLFSGYMVWSGFRHARRGKGVATRLDRWTAWTMVGVGGAMLLLGAGMLFRGAELAVVLLVFGPFAIALGAMDARSHGSGPSAPGERIASHLRMMLGGTIAALTAFATTVIPGPALLVWLGPTVLITPLIVFWSRRVLDGAGPLQPEVENLHVDDIHQVRSDSARRSARPVRPRPGS